MSPKIQSIRDKVVENLGALIDEAADQIEEAMIKVAAESQTQETDAKFVMGFKMTTNLDKNQLDTELAWNVKHKLSTTDELPDPNQPSLFKNPITLSDGTQTVTVGKSKLKAKK